MLDENLLFVLFRLLFIVTKPGSSPDYVTELLEALVLDTVTSWMEYFAAESLHNASLLYERNKSILDMSKCLIALTVDLGPLGKNNAELMVKYIPRFNR